MAITPTDLIYFNKKGPTGRKIIDVNLKKIK
jgi:hypothetical protein